MTTTNDNITTLHIKDKPFHFVLVKKGTFMMGNNESKYDDEKPIHPVTMSKDFYIGQYLVTQAQWKAIMGEADFPNVRFKGDNRPIERVSWQDVQQFLAALNQTQAAQTWHQKDGKQFRLSTEAQWEYAARGGEAGAQQNYTYAGSNRLKEVAWYHANSHHETKPVGLKFPNQLGCYDMSGNVWEWCEDHWHDNYENAPKNGSAWLNSGATKNDSRVVRGGSWFDDYNYCRVSYRYWDYASYRDVIIGFRLSRY